MKRSVVLTTCLVLFALQIVAQQTKPHFSKGRYTSISRLIHDSVEPRTPCEAYVQSSSEMYTEYVLYDSVRSKRIKPVFAYSDGDTVYLFQGIYRANDAYTKSLEVGRFLYFEDLYRSKAASGAIVALAGGAIGLAVAAAASNRIIRVHQPIDFHGIPSGRVCGIILDTQTGAIRGVNPDNFAEVFSEAPDIVERFKLSPQKLRDVRLCIRELNKRY